MRRLMWLVVLLLSYCPAFALPGDLDTSFGVSGGYVVTDLADAHIDERNFDTAIQPDGKIVVVGRRDRGVTGTSDFLIARYNPDGTLDTTFSGDGYFTSFDGAGTDTLNAVAIQTDGKIVAVGGVSESVATATVFRFNTDGSLDTTFSGDGIQTIVSSGYALSFVIQTDGKIVLAAAYNGGAFPTGFQTVVVRLNVDGSLDTTFDGDGRRLVSDISNSTIYRPTGFALQTDGKFVLAGQSSTNAIHNFTIVRLSSNGTLDTTFDGDGIVRYNARPGAAQSVLIQSNGKILAAGGVEVTTGNDPTMMRFNSDGTFDTTFDVDGVKTIELVGNNEDYFFNEIIEQADGQILGIADWDNVYADFVRDDFYVLRFDPDGSTDSSFDANGIVRSPWCEDGHDIALQTDGKIITLGSQDRSNDGVTNGGICVQRYWPDGTIDVSFNSIAPTGKLALSTYGITQADAVAGLPNGKIMVAGWSDYGGLTEGVLMRFNTNGTLDTSFMNEGFYFKNNGTSLSSTNFYDLRVLNDGGFYVAGGSDSIGGLIIKFNSAGTLDTTFSGDGIASSSSATRFYALAVQTDGKVVGCGSLGTTTRSGRIVRFLSTGTVETFSADNMGGSVGDSEILECSLQSNGKLIAAGFSNDGTSERVAVSRHSTSLSLDTTFGASGYALSDMSPSLNDRATDMAVQSDDRIVVSSTGVNGSGDRDFAILRYTSNGTLDTNFTNRFGTNGISLVDFIVSNPDDDAYSLLLQPDGQLIVGGSNNAGTGERFALAKLDADGSLALGFGILGRTVTAFPNSDARITALGFHLFGQLLAAGRTWNGTDYDFAIARYQNELIVTAANVSVNGRVTTASGSPIGNATIWLTGGDLEAARTVRTNPFGYYSLADIPSGRTYILTVAAKGRVFADPSRIINLQDGLTDVDFISQEK